MPNKKQVFYYTILLFFPILFFAPLLMSDSIMTYSDGIGYEAQFEMIRIALRNGQFPQWNPFVANGTPFAADIQNKVFYPLVYPCLIFPRHLDYKVFFILHLILNNIFSFNLFKKLVKDERIALYGALIVSFSNLIIIRQDHINILCAIVWIPLMVHLMLQLFEANAKKYAVYLGIVMALQFLAGFPQTAFYTDIILALLYIYFSVKRRVKLGTFLINGMLIAISYIGIAAIQILPLSELAIYSGRSYITYEYFSHSAADIRYLLNLLNPVFWGQYGSLLHTGMEFPTDLYIGIIPITLVIYALIYCRRRQEVKILSCIAVIVFILSCSCNNIPMLGKILYKLPLLGSFRVLSRLLIFFSGPLLWMGVIGLKHVVENSAYRKMRIISMGTGGIYALLYGCFYIMARKGIFSDSIWNDYFATPEWFYKSIVVLVVAIIMWTIFEQSQKLCTGMPFILAVSIFAISLWDTYFYNTDPATDIFHQSAMLRYGNHESNFETEETAFLMESPEIDKYKYFVSYESWQELAATSWAIRANGNVHHRFNTILAYITFENPLFVQELCGVNHGQFMNANHVMAITNPTFLQMLSVKYIITNNQVSYAWNGVTTVYQQYPLERDDSAQNDIPIPVELDLSRTHTVHAHIRVKSGKGLLSIMLGDEVLYSQEMISGDNFICYTIPAGSGQELPLQLQFDDLDMVTFHGVGK